MVNDIILAVSIYVRSGQKKPGCSCLAFSKTAKDLTLTYCSRGYCINILATGCRMGTNLRRHSQGKNSHPGKGCGQRAGS